MLIKSKMFLNEDKRIKEGNIYQIVLGNCYFPKKNKYYVRSVKLWNEVAKKIEVEKVLLRVSSIYDKITIVDIVKV